VGVAATLTDGQSGLVIEHAARDVGERTLRKSPARHLRVSKQLLAQKLLKTGRNWERATKSVYPLTIT
jgi:hypothetical protein